MLKKVLKAITAAEYAVTGFLFVAALTVLFLNVIFRRVSFLPAFDFAEEFMRYCSVWITFIGLSICAEEDSHVGVDIVYQLSKPKMRKVLKILCMFAAFLFCAFFTISCWNYVRMAWTNHQKSPVMQVPLWAIYTALPIGAFLSTVHYFLKLVWYLRVKPQDLDDKPVEDPKDFNLLNMN